MCTIPVANMADAFPTEYDAIVLGTGLAEAVVAAALSRVGHKVLHLDRNDYYSSYWASFSFENLQEWIKRNSQEVKTAKGCEELHGVDDAADLKTDEKHLRLPLNGNGIANIEVRSFLRKIKPEKDEKLQSEEIKENGKHPNNVSTELKHDIKTTGTEDVKPDNSTESRVCSTTDGEHGHESKEQSTVSTDGEHGHESKEQSTVSTDGEHGHESKEQSTVSTDGEHGHESKEQSTVSTDGEHGHELNNPDIIDSPEVDSTQSTTVTHAVSWAERRKMKKEIKLGRDSTFENFLEQSRKFNLDLAPKLLFSRGSLVESLIGANIAHYAEFKVVSRILTYMNGCIEEVPCSRSDVFGSELINVLEKRSLMKFITFCANFEDSPEQYLDFQDKPFIDFLKARKLTPNLQHIIIHAIAIVPESTTTLCALKATQKFLQSLGRYGNTPFLWSLYGSGELPQAFCRMCAVFGGIYCLRKSVNCLVVDEPSNRCVGIISEDGQRLNTKWLIMEKSYAPEIFEVESPCMISRAILVTDKSLKPSSREHVTFLTLAAGDSSSVPVRAIELSPSSMACPESLYVVHLTTETSSTALEDLENYVKQLFTTPDDEESDGEKPAVLWAVYFNRKCFMPKASHIIPENVKLTSLPSSQLDFEDAMKEAKSIFTSICPDEEFLLAVPNPEDIIWDDYLSNPETKQKAVGDEQLASDPKEHPEETTTADEESVDPTGGSTEHKTKLDTTSDDTTTSVSDMPDKDTAETTDSKESTS